MVEASNYPTSGVLGHRLRIILVEAEFIDNLTATQIPDTTRQPRHAVVGDGPQTPSRSGLRSFADMPDSDIAALHADARLSPV